MFGGVRETPGPSTDLGEHGDQTRMVRLGVQGVADRRLRRVDPVGDQEHLAVKCSECGIADACVPELLCSGMRGAQASILESRIREAITMASGIGGGAIFRSMSLCGSLLAVESCD
jgi:hypothetical protein